MDRGRTRESKVRLDKVVGANIRREREVRKLSRDELAEVVDLTTSHLGLIERGERGATPVTLEKLVKAFGVTIDSLFTAPRKMFSARERRDNKGSYYSKVCTLLSHLTEPELEMLTYTIKGITSMRKHNKTGDEGLEMALEELELQN